MVPLAPSGTKPEKALDEGKVMTLGNREYLKVLKQMFSADPLLLGRTPLEPQDGATRPR